MKKHNTMLFVILMAVMIMFVGSLEWPEDVSAAELDWKFGYLLDADIGNNSGTVNVNPDWQGKIKISGDPHENIHASAGLSVIEDANLALNLSADYYPDGSSIGACVNHTRTDWQNGRKDDHSTLLSICGKHDLFK